MARGRESLRDERNCGKAADFRQILPLYSNNLEPRTEEADIPTIYSITIITSSGSSDSLNSLFFGSNVEANIPQRTAHIIILQRLFHVSSSTHTDHVSPSTSTCSAVSGRTSVGA